MVPFITGLLIGLIAGGVLGSLLVAAMSILCVSGRFADADDDLPPNIVVYEDTHEHSHV